MFDCLYLTQQMQKVSKEKNTLIFILGQELKNYADLNHPPQVVEKVTFEYNFYAWDVLWLLPSDFRQD